MPGLARRALFSARRERLPGQLYGLQPASGVDGRAYGGDVAEGSHLYHESGRQYLLSIEQLAIFVRCSFARLAGRCRSDSWRALGPLAMAVAVHRRVRFHGGPDVDE